MPRRVIITVQETSANARDEDLPGGARIGRKPPHMPLVDKSRWILRGRQAAARHQEWVEQDHIQGVGPSADDALRHARKLMDEARRMK